MTPRLHSLRETLRHAAIPGHPGLIRHLSIGRNLLAAWRNRAWKAWVYREAPVVLRHASLAGSGMLVLGAQWPGGLHRRSRLVLRAGARCFLKAGFRIHEGARVTLGSGYANSGANISVSGSLTIGHGVAIAENVTIWDADGHAIEGRPAGPRPVVIGNHVWIGLNATILKGVTIGDGAVIAAGAVVNRDVRAGRLAAGVPARPIQRS